MGRTVLALKKKALAENPLKCPECGHVSQSKALLGVHRRMKHGILGMSIAAIHDREKKAARENGAVAIDPNNPLQCQLCGLIARNGQGLSVHKNAAHPVENQPKETSALQVPIPVIDRSDPLQCQFCDFKAMMKSGLSHHMTRIHGAPPSLKSHNRKRREIEPTQAIEIAPTNGSKNNVLHASEESHVVTDGIPEATIAVAYGRFRELCRSIAYEHDLPERLFTRRVASLVYAASLRQ
jgi:uncharacterized C2H2 Zn-finger protein